jgi:hypothetical protein
MPADEVHAGDQTSHIMILDIRRRRIEFLSRACCEGVDLFGTMAACGANGGGCRMQRSRRLVSSLIQLFPGGPTQVLNIASNFRRL